MSAEGRLLDVVLADPTMTAVLLQRPPAPRHVYETKAAQWTTVWPGLTVLPWEDGDRPQ